MSPVLHDLSLSHAANKRLAAAVGDRQIQRGTGKAAAGTRFRCFCIDKTKDDIILWVRRGDVQVNQ